MPSKASAAQVKLAQEATDSGWPTTPMQVNELQERKVLPATVVTRRGRGKTTSEFPPGALDVLLAVRRSSAMLRAHRRFKHHRAVVLAWLAGADVRDGDPVTDRGLRWSLLKWIDDAHYQAAGPGPRREHRKVGKAIAPFDLDNVLSTPADRKNALTAAAALIRGEQPDPAVAESLVPLFAEIFKMILEAAKNSDATLDGIQPPNDEELFDQIRLALQRKQPTWGENPGGSLDLSAITAAKLVADADRPTLDAARDTVMRILGPEALENMDGQWAAVGMVVGQLSAAPFGGGFPNTTKE